MSAGDTEDQIWQGGDDLRLASDRWSGRMGRWAARTATVAGFAFSGTGRQRRLYVPLATTALAGAQSAADKAKLDAYPDYTSVDTRLDALEALGLVTPTAWANLSYAANWSDFGAGQTTGQYRKNHKGYVEVVGTVKKGVALALPDTIATLPSGYRPSTAVIRPASGSGGVYAEVRVTTAGALVLNAGGSATYTAFAFEFDPAK